jgi:predicted dehydrogenase
MLDRRRFFGIAGGAITNRLTAGPTRIRAAVLGTGHAHALGKIRALRSLPQYELAGICRPDADEPNEGDVFQGVRWLSLDQVLGDPTIELVVVESRVQRNLQYAQHCVNAGKFVHLDKAPGEDLPALRELLVKAAARKRVVQMGYQWRYHPAMQAAIEAARKGWLGKVYALRATIDKPIPPSERTELAKFRGGMMFELGCHLIDRAVDLLGKPTRVTGILRHHSTISDGLADNTLAILEYESAVAEIYVAAFQPHGDRYRSVEILGTNGKATAEPFSPLRLTVDLKDAAGIYKAGVQTIEPPEPPGPSFAPDFIEMAKVIREGMRPSYSPEHDLAAQETLLRACGVI